MIRHSKSPEVWDLELSLNLGDGLMDQAAALG